MKKLVLAAVLLLAASAAWAALPMIKTEADASNPVAPASKAAMWDSLSLFTAAGTIRCAAVGDGDNDTDTLETFIGMSAAPRDLRMITSLTANTVRSDLIYQGPTNRGIQCVAVGNADSLPGNEVVFGTQQAAASFRSYVGMSKWDGFVWTTTLLDSSWLSTVANGQQVHAIKVGDVNGDGLNEIVYAMGDTLKMLRYNAATGLFDKSVILSYGVGTGAHIYGMDIGDFDPDHAGLEIAICTNYGYVVEVYWNGTGWSTNGMYVPGTGGFNFLAIGDFDPDHAGNEVAFTRFSAPTTEIYEIYGGSAGAWTTAKIYTSAAGAQANGIVVGNFDATHAGNELAYAQYGTKQVIQLKKTGGIWYDEVTFTGGAEMTEWWGLGGGNANPYHAGDELIACNSAPTTRRALRIQDRAVTTEWAMSSVSHDGPFVTRNQLVWIQAKMLNNSIAANKAIFLNRVNRPDGSIQTSTIDSSASTINPGEFYTYSYGITADTVGKWAVAESMAVTGDSIAANDCKLGIFRAAELFTYPVNEGFEASLLPSANWDTITVASGATPPVWSRVTAGTFPATTPHNASVGMAKFNSYDASSGGQARLVLWPAFLPTAGYNFSFWMYHYSSGGDSMLVDISTDRGVTWTKVAGYPLIGTAGWSQKAINLSPYAGDTVVIALRGRSAYGYNIFVDDIAITSPPAHEVEARRIVRPATGVYPINASLAVQAMVCNNGMNAENFQTVIVVKDTLGAVAFTDSVATSIPALDSLLVTLPAYTAASAARDTIIITANLPGDELPANNIKAQVVNFNPAFDVPLTEGIEGTTFPAAYWSTQTVSGTNTWTRVTTGTNPACSPFRGAAMAKFNSYDASGGQTRLITPFVSIPAGETYLSFAMYGDPAYPSDGDSVHIDVSTDYGATWTNGIAGFDRRLAVAAWRRFTVDLSAYAGSTALVALRGVSSYGDNIFIDEVHIGQRPTIVSTSPANGATDVALDEPVVIAYSAPMDTLTVLGYIDPAHAQTVSWSATMDTLTLTPDVPYAYNTAYTMYDTSGTDMYGLVLEGLPVSFSFTTIANQGPAIALVLQPADTYDGTGPFLVRAVITDPAKAGIVADTLFYTTGSAWQSVLHSVVSGDTVDYSIPGPLAAGTLIEYFIGAWDDQGDGNYSPVNAPIGVYSFRILDPLPPTALVATGLDMAVDLSWAPPAEELIYDQNTVPYWWPGFPAGGILSTRFTPQHYPCKLEQAVSLWYDNIGIDSLLVHIYADDGTGMPDEGNQLLTPFKILPLADPSYTVVDLSGYDIVLASGDFHIGYEVLTTGMPVPLFDYYLPPTRSLYKWTDGSWYGDLDANNIHRATVTYSAYSKKGLALKSARLRKGQKPNYVLHNNQAPKLSAVNAKQAPVYPTLTGALAIAKNINGYTVLRGDVTGGPYISIGTATNPIYMDMTAANGTPYFYVVRAEYTIPDTFSANSNEATATPAALPILLVDDDGSEAGWPDRRGIYTAAMDNAGYTGQYTVYQVANSPGADGPSAPWYSGRTQVVWWSGAQWSGANTLTFTDEANLATYLNGGGKLFYCAQDYLWDRYPSAGAFTAGEFPYDYLGVASVDQDVITTPYNIAGVTGSLAAGLSYAVIEDPATGIYADNLTKRPVAGTYNVLDVTAKVGEKTGVAYDNGTFRTVFFTTLFEDITDGANTKAELMTRILSWLTTGVEGKPPALTGLPTVYSLSKCSPNPVKGHTTVKFALPKAGHVSIAVYNIMGQKVKTMVNGQMNAGYHSVNWNGRNESGQPVSAGVYLYKMQADGFNTAQKLVVVR